MGLRVSTTTTFPYSNGMGYTMDVLIGRKMRFEMSAVSMASLGWFLTDIHLKRVPSVSPTTTFLTMSVYIYI